jgi:hypothetical protein
MVAQRSVSEVIGPEVRLWKENSKGFEIPTFSSDQDAR